MDTQVILVSGIVAGAVFLLASETLRVDLVAVVVCLSLAWLGLVSPLEAISGFASNAVIAMAAVMVLGAGLERSGVTSRIATWIVRHAGDTRRRVVAATSLSAGLISSVIHNVGAAALFLPVARRISARSAIPVSRLAMPIGFAAILGGTVTMIGSGPLIILNDLFREAGADPLPLFAVTPVGIFLLLAGVALFALAGEWIFPPGRDETGNRSVAETWGIDGPVLTCTVREDSPLAGKTREDIRFEDRYGLVLLATREGDDISVAPPRSTRIGGGQQLALLGRREDFDRFCADWGCVPGGEADWFGEILSEGGFSFAEVVVRPRASIRGRTPREIMFRRRFSIEPVLLARCGEEMRADFSDVPLSAGDILVVFGSWENLLRLSDNPDLQLISRPEGEPVRRGKGALAVAIFAGALALSQAGVPLSLSLLSGAAAMVLSGVIDLPGAYRAIDWKVIVLIGGMLPLGTAIEKTGAAAQLAGFLAGYLEGAHPLVVMLAIAVIATALSLVISNVAATVLLVPIAMLAGESLGIDPKSLALLAAVCTQNSFVLPTHQVNALLMGPGGYRTRDYLRAGSIMTAIFIAVAVTLMYLLAA
ncbi:MAG: SLC13 family permease [Methanolinea sp.]|nr:SLC13 family permease [Methanolinea sp.]